MSKRVETLGVTKKSTKPVLPPKAAVAGEKPKYRKTEYRRAVSRLKAALQEEADPREKVLARAVEVIENEERALRWMGTPVKALGFATPVSLLGTAKGRSAVLHVLGQLEHGLW